VTTKHTLLSATATIAMDRQRNQVKLAEGRECLIGQRNLGARNNLAQQGNRKVDTVSDWFWFLDSYPGHPRISTHVAKIENGFNTTVFSKTSLKASTKDQLIHSVCFKWRGFSPPPDNDQTTDLALQDFASIFIWEGGMEKIEPSSSIGRN